MEYNTTSSKADRVTIFKTRQQLSATRRSPTKEFLRDVQAATPSAGSFSSCSPAPIVPRQVRRIAAICGVLTSAMNHHANDDSAPEIAPAPSRHAARHPAVAVPSRLRKAVEATQTV
ncbi:hypothetical protein OHD62_33070 [Mesorhizobium sp. YC-39]|uniref:hypothetical protein n=1 Tax=unclassified Mesorhizobium TaxID=325217 RepID=UPI0021E7F448|nr:MULTISPECIES: hypothetical protein [unclassified Mesorhizobium]MCV3211438.1 hypothetical protein [Mesorhizobium sp. YC-2]MCV3233206.1 hypothetical protein [Mesorhizobium sp. YC-39]